MDLDSMFYDDYDKSIYEADDEDLISEDDILEVTEVGDYIIKGIQGELYPCKPDIFKATYEEIK